ncbi:hypothetical protein [Algoriphagus algorifonticola]|uniref:hypothetical protein n=1 Tax=Algoriphagus algorifonticola TaxID=2593007 RepID=UPI00119EABBF|nr:hypothetical protein [Algoriphagus algorifonticola]
MKKQLLIIAFLLGSYSLSAQSLEGRIRVEGFSSGQVLKEAVPVDLFKSFKENKYKIMFSYKADQVGKRGIVLFDMKTTLIKDGKTIHHSSRGNWPWLPGDTYVPIEAFDLIPALQNEVYEMPVPRLDWPKLDSNLPKGKYTVRLEMVPVGEIRGSISPAEFSFRIE